MAENVFKPLGIEDTTFYSGRLSERTQGRTVPCSYRDAERGTVTNAASSHPWTRPSRAAALGCGRPQPIMPESCRPFFEPGSGMPVGPCCRRSPWTRCSGRS